MQVWTSKKPRKSFAIKTTLIISFLIVGGCDNWKCTTFEYENRSKEHIRVDVKGISPNPSVGVLGAGVGTHELSGASLEFDGPVRFSDVITIEWTTKEGENKRTQELKRSDLKIPPVVRRGEVRIIYSEEGKWSIKYK